MALGTSSCNDIRTGNEYAGFLYPATNAANSHSSEIVYICIYYWIPVI
ncbi:MAG: hypothetical protein J6C10_06815 [Prevotella sp.]|nr:hypothetical protein [Prevotella sp.]